MSYGDLEMIDTWFELDTNQLAHFQGIQRVSLFYLLAITLFLKLPVNIQKRKVASTKTLDFFTSENESRRSSKYFVF